MPSCYQSNVQQHCKYIDFIPQRCWQSTNQRETLDSYATRWALSNECITHYSYKHCSLKRETSTGIFVVCYLYLCVHNVLKFVMQSAVDWEENTTVIVLDRGKALVTIGLCRKTSGNMSFSVLLPQNCINIFDRPDWHNFSRDNLPEQQIWKWKLVSLLWQTQQYLYSHVNPFVKHLQGMIFALASIPENEFHLIFNTTISCQGNIQQCEQIVENRSKMLIYSLWEWETEPHRTVSVRACWSRLDILLIRWSNLLVSLLLYIIWCLHL